MMSLEDLQTLVGSNVILLMGAPLSGKGTQGKLLSKALSRPCVSTGDLFRLEIATGSSYGQKIKAYMDIGELIPNDLTTEFLTMKLSDQIYENGMILDGYPRNMSHLPLLENILLNIRRSIFVAIFLDVPKSELDRRRSDRERIDDSQQTFERRYDIFLKETLPLIDLLKTRNKVAHIKSCSESPEQIHQMILSNFTTHQQ